MKKQNFHFSRREEKMFPAKLCKSKFRINMETVVMERQYYACSTSEYFFSIFPRNSEVNSAELRGNYEELFVTVRWLSQ